MGYINIYVSNDAYIKVKNKQLELTSGENKLIHPLEDINSIMIESLQTTVTTYTLSKLSEYKIIVYICDQKHLPVSVLLPYYNNYNQLLVSMGQLNMTEPQKNRLWQKIIINKIKNQSNVLKLLCKNYKNTEFFATQVISGDKTNQEAAASSAYFKELFGKGFSRGSETPVNAALNYGYSIIRGLIARSVSVHGLIPFVGIWHSNQFNNFNLVDDFIEVFRPVVDLFVYRNKEDIEKNETLTSEIKAQLFNLINVDVIVGRANYTVSVAVEMLINSFVQTIKNKNYELIDVYIQELQMHRYE